MAPTPVGFKEKLTYATTPSLSVGFMPPDSSDVPKVLVMKRLGIKAVVNGTKSAVNAGNKGVRGPNILY
jgi:hypothetical protein